MKARLETFASSHLQIKEIRFGELEEVSNQGEYLFPYMFCMLQPSRFEGTQLVYVIDIIIMDLVNKNLDNRWEVWSDIALIMSDLRAYLNTPSFDDDYILENDFQITPFADRFTDDVTGWLGVFELKINDVKDRCVIPLS